MRVGHERVRRRLRRQGLCSVYRGRYRVTTDSAHQKPIAPNVLDRRFDAWSVNRSFTRTAAANTPATAIGSSSATIR